MKNSLEPIFPQSKNTRIVFYIQCAVYFWLLLVFLAFSDFYHWMDGEDGPIESTGALFLLLASVFLILGSIRYFKSDQKNKTSAWLLLIAGVAFFWAAGEEVSWGQRFIGVQTPDWLAAINGQKETNLHNINKKFFDRMVEHITWIMTLIPAVLHFTGRQKILGFRVPEVPIVFGFVVLPIYHRYENLNIEFYHIVNLVLIAYVVFAAKKREWSTLKLATIALATMASVYLVHTSYAELFLDNPNIHNEVRETMFGFLCMGYALQLWTDSKKV